MNNVKLPSGSLHQEIEKRGLVSPLLLIFEQK